MRPLRGVDVHGIVHELQSAYHVPDDHWRISSYATRCQTTWIETPTDEDTARLTSRDWTVDCLACIAKGDAW